MTVGPPETRAASPVGDVSKTVEERDALGSHPRTRQGSIRLPDHIYSGRGLSCVLAAGRQMTALRSQDADLRDALWLSGGHLLLSGAWRVTHR